MAPIQYPELSCPACGEPMANRPTEAGKPHYICEPCGTQLFIRREAGIERLRERAENRKKKGASLWG